MKKSREEIRNQRANDVCRELRFQMSQRVNEDPEVLFHFLMKWMRVSKKDRYTRPVK